VVSADAGIFTRMMHRSPLTDDDVTGFGPLAAEKLYA
jgi:hypothetical protein